MNAHIGRIQHDLIQGTPEWDAFRLNHFGASEAAAMLGLSKKVKRSELLRMKHTGIAKEFSDWVQENILNHGHEVEAMARPIIEDLIGESLYPVTFSYGDLSASCDGLTVGDDVAFEHKQFAAELFASVKAGVLPEEHMPQVQQIMLVTGAKLVVFVCSDGTPENFASMEIFQEHAWFAKLEAGWAQFKKDLANYTPPAPEQVVVAAPKAQLPAVMVRVDGALTVTDNLKEFGEQLAAYVATLNFNPQTDQDFADLDAAVKLLKRAEEEIDEREAGAMAQIEAVSRLRQIAASVRENARQPRLRGEKVVKSGKEERKVALVTAAAQSFAKHVAALQDEISAIRFSPPIPIFGESTKGLKTISSIQDKIDTALANGKIVADQMATDIRMKLSWLDANAAEHRALLADLQQLIAKPFDDFKLAVTARIEAHKKAEYERLEAERQKIRIEEAQRAEEAIAAAAREQQKQIAESQRKASAEAAAKIEADRKEFATPPKQPPPSLAQPDKVTEQSETQKVTRDQLITYLENIVRGLTNNELSELIAHADHMTLNREEAA